MVVDHAKGTLPAAYDALAAEKAPVSVIGNYKLFSFRSCIVTMIALAGQSMAHKPQPVQASGVHFKKLRRRAGEICLSNG